jgi:hypothetical protein
MKHSRNISLASRIAAFVLLLAAACERSAPGPADGTDGNGARPPSLGTELRVLSDWEPHVSAPGLFSIFGPRKRTTSELTVPTPVGEQLVPVTYFNLDGNIFYVSSHVRDPRLGADERQILDAQAQGILSRFEKYEVHKEPFVAHGRPALRLRLQRPDSYKIIELHLTPLRMYQVVTDLPAEHRLRLASLAFRTTFTPLTGGAR